MEENEVLRPDDFVVKSVASKSGNKVYIIQSIDRKMALEDIAAAKGLDLDELLTEIEAIVSTGTRLDINYYIEENLDEDVVDEIYDWFKEEAASDSLEEALAALRSDYEDLEIRLVRIKFLCDRPPLRLRGPRNPPRPHQVPLRGRELAAVRVARLSQPSLIPSASDF